VGATVRLSSGQGAVSDVNGLVEITNVMQDSIRVTVSFVGFETWEEEVVLPVSGTLAIILSEGEELEELIVTATRSSRVIENIPTRVEAISTEELSEKAIMRSNNIAMVLRESTGIQMQQTSASSANQSIRIQGLDGRYTQLLKDGFPLYSGFSGGLSIMQIPPLDLRQVEVIKGSSSTLFGGGAIAGLVNLVSITPEDERKIKIMLDQTTAGGTTLNGFYAGKTNKVGFTMFASANRQEAYDPNDDGFSDIPEIRSLTLNPSLFYYFNDRSDLRITLNSTIENRLGGDMQIIDGEPTGRYQFTEENESERLSYQLTYNYRFDENRVLNVKTSLTYFDRKITEPEFVFNGQQWSSFSEVSYSFGSEWSDWIGGLNLYTDQFIETPFDTLSRDYDYTTFGVFAQNMTELSRKLTLESGLRTDYNPEYGTFILPRVSLMAKVNPELTIRAGGGLGYKLPTIFTEEAESQTFEGILPIMDDAMDAERSIGGNLDFNYSKLLGKDWTLSVNQLFFYTSLDNALVFEENAGGQFFYDNADGLVVSRGLETNLKVTYKDFKFFANYALIDTRLKYENADEQKPLTPKHNLGSVLVYEEEGKWRIGLEAYYTGRQFKSDRTQTDDFWLVGLMVMRKIGKVSLYVNFENFTDTRQHRLEDFAIETYIKPNFPEFWAPTDGRIINAGFILEL
ncbi:MAG: TonB-dependent receptor, partial [Cyclobacteriaceae bacterium]